MVIKRKPPRLGQHLLTSHTIARAVVAAAHVSKKDTVLEIGPGKGMLTGEILATGARVRAVEKDPQMVATLEDVFAAEIANAQLTLYTEDARTFLQNTEHAPVLNAGYKIVANIPYYITGALLRLFLTAPVQPTDVSLLVQKEVAERIVKNKKESILSLSVQAYGTPHYVRTVKAGSFNPPPNVDSAILAISNISRKNFTGAVSEEKFFELLHSGFGQKRKTLLGNLKKAFSGEHSAVSITEIEEVFKHYSIDKKVRAEDVPLETWLRLARELKTET